MSRIYKQPTFVKKDSSVTTPVVVEKRQDAVSDQTDSGESDLTQPEPSETKVESPSEPEPAPTPDAIKDNAEVDQKSEPSPQEAPKKEEKAIWKRIQAWSQSSPTETRDATAAAPVRVVETVEKSIKQEVVPPKKEQKPVGGKRVLPNPATVETSTPIFASQDASPTEAMIQRILSPALEQIQMVIKKMKRVVSQKFEELEARLDREEEARAKITTWIKTNIGPNLEKVREIAKEEVKSSSLASVSSVSTSSGALKKSGPTSSSKSPSSGATKFQRSSSKQQEDEWTDGEEDPAPARAQTSNFIGSVSAPTASRDPRIKPRRLCKNAKLARLEEETFGSNDIERFDLPVNDASAKVGLSRANYFLTNQAQAVNQYRSPDLYDKVRNFAEKGGQVLFVPLSDADRKKDNFVFAIKSNDKVYPICPDGLNRSQVLYLALMGLKRVLGVSDGVALPHGARCGFDPFVVKDDPDDASRQYFHIVAKGKRAKTNSKAFMEAFGQDKSQRFGEETCGPSELRIRLDDDDEDGKRDPLNDIQVQQVMKARQRMREYFDLYYYSLKAANAEEAKGRRIYITFGSAVPIVIERLLESNYRADLPRALVVALPYGVEPYEKPSAQDLKALYKFYASLFVPVAE